MLVHHLTTSSLYFGYIYGNVIKFGSVVAYLHDIADVPTSLGKLLSSTIFPKAAMAVGIVMMSLWFLTRIYMLPQFIYSIFMHKGFTSPQEVHFNAFLQLNGVLLSVMFALHAFWFFMFFKIISRYCKKGTVDDPGR